MKKILAAAMCLALLAFCACSALAVPPEWDDSVYTRGVAGTTIDGWEYDVNALTGAAAIVGYRGTDTAVTVPASVNGYAVDVLFDGAMNGSVTKAVLSQGIKCIAAYAFTGCEGLEEVTVPSSVNEIDPNAFMDAPSRLILYGYSGSAAERFAAEKGYVFAAIDRGETVSRGVTPDGFAYVVNNGEAILTGYGGSNTVVTLPSHVNGIPVIAVGNGAFRNASFTGVTVPQGISQIGGQAFFNCMELTHIDLPSSVTSIGEMGLSCCDALTSLTLPEGLVRLGNDALSQCNSLAYLKLPSTLRTAEHGALSYLPCASIELPEGMAELSDWLFFGTQLRRFTVPAGVRRIGQGTFVCCESLMQVVIPAGVTAIEDKAFVDADHGFFPTGLTICGYRGTEAERYANTKGIPFAALDAPAAIRITLPEDLRILDSQVLSNTAAESVYVNAACTVIRDRAFENCAALREVHVAGMNTAIEEEAFYGCAYPVVVYAPAGSEAIRCAQEHGFPWMAE